MGIFGRTAIGMDRSTFFRHVLVFHAVTVLCVAEKPAMRFNDAALIYFVYVVAIPWLPRKNLPLQLPLLTPLSPLQLLIRRWLVRGRPSIARVPCIHVPVLILHRHVHRGLVHLWLRLHLWRMDNDRRRRGLTSASTAATSTIHPPRAALFPAHLPLDASLRLALVTRRAVRLRRRVALVVAGGAVGYASLGDGDVSFVVLPVVVAIGCLAGKTE